MKTIQRYQTEKAIIDALLTISEIIKKTTHSKRLTGDGDRKQQYHLDSYISSFNKKYGMSSSSSSQRPINYNRSPFVVWNKRQNYRDDNSSISSRSDNYYRKKSSRYYPTYRSERKRRIRYED